MPGKTYLPTREPDLLSFAQNLNSRLTGTPGAYGLAPGQVTGYTALFTAFQSAYTLATESLTRTSGTIAAKNTAKQNLINGTNGIRQLVNIIQHNPATTDQQREDLQITVPDVEPTPVPVPEFAPGIEIISSINRNVRIRLWDTQNPENRGKPAGVDGAAILSSIGALPPAPEDIAAWKFEGLAGRVNTDIEFDPDVTSGTTAWITAYWFNTRKESGPSATPISVQIPGTLMAVT